VNYRNANGEEVSLKRLCREEPAWAASQIRRYEQLRQAALDVLAAAYVGDGKIVCPLAFESPLRRLADELKGIVHKDTETQEDTNELLDMYFKAREILFRGLYELAAANITDLRNIPWNGCDEGAGSRLAWEWDDLDGKWNYLTRIHQEPVKVGDLVFVYAKHGHNMGWLVFDEKMVRGKRRCSKVEG
jgi:hypothetical protein